MKKLIAAFERDLPDLFPMDGYNYDNFPYNTQEYWYNHALHDVWHFMQIREALRTYLSKSADPESDCATIQRGIDTVFTAKMSLYSFCLDDLG